MSFSSDSENFRDSCKFMTFYAQNQIEQHKDLYFELNVRDFFLLKRKAYSNIMKCYENSRQTNEESEACSDKYKSFMTLT
jgi:hypothetical protein